jgi:NADP-dependent 3-hydroxy acid dehydrogenase YdfG
MKVMSTNLESAFFVTQQAYPMLKASGSASVVMISSIAGVVAIRTGSIYAMTKGQCLFVSLCRSKLVLMYYSSSSTYSLWTGSAFMDCRKTGILL